MLKIWIEKERPMNLNTNNKLNNITIHSITFYLQDIIHIASAEPQHIPTLNGLSQDPGIESFILLE